MPGDLVDIYIETLGEIQAEEALMQISNMQIGSGLVERNDAERTLRRLRMVAKMDGKAQVPSIAMIQDMGIGVSRG